MNANSNNPEVSADVVTAAASRRKNTGAVIASAAAVIAGGYLVAWTSVPAVRNYVRLLFMKPDRYCQYVYQSASDAVESVAERSFLNDVNASEVKLSLNLTDSFMENFTYILDGPLFNSLDLTVNTVRADGKQKADITVESDGRYVISADTAAEGEICYIRFPDAGDSWFSYDMGDKAEKISTASAFSDITDEEISDIFGRYSVILTEFIGEADNTIEKACTGEAEDVPYRYNNITTEFSPELADAFAERIADEMRSDEVLKRIYGKAGLSGDYDKMTEKFRDNCSGFKDGFTLVTGVDANGVIRALHFYDGRDIKEGDKAAAGFIMTSRNNRFALVADGFGITVKVTGMNMSGQLTGEFVISSGGKSRSVLFEDLYFEDDRFVNGRITTDFTEQTHEYLGRTQLLFKREDDCQIISTEVTGTGSAQLRIRSFRDDKADIAVPENSEDNFIKYFASLDRKKLSSSLYEGLGIDIKSASQLFGIFGFPDTLVPGNDKSGSSGSSLYIPDNIM